MAIFPYQDNSFSNKNKFLAKSRSVIYYSFENLSNQILSKNGNFI